MKHLKLAALSLSIALSVQLKAGVIDQPFNPAFGPDWTTSDPGETDGWKYVSLAKVTNNAANVYYGDAAVRMQTYSYQSDPNSYLITPEKTGGVGWITFLYKTYEANTWSQGNCELAVQVSENGETFTAIDTVRTSIQDGKTWFRYSKTVNSATAKHVKLELLKNPNFSTNMAVDEIGITDAQTPDPVNLRLSFNPTLSMESETGQTVTISNAFFVAGHVPGGVTLSLDKGENSPFSLDPTAIESITAIIPTVVNVAFTPRVKSISSDFIQVTGANLPRLVFPLSGLGLERTVVEGFNPENTLYTNSFDYLGWSVVNGSFETGTAYNIYEGSGVVRFSTSLTSPKKAGGIGSFSFFYRAEKIYEPVSFIVSSSTDGTAWTEIDRITASLPYFTQYVQTLSNDADANYVKVELEAPSNAASLLLIDAFSITAKNAPLPSATGNEVKYLAENASCSFSVPVTFANLTGDVTVSIDHAQLQTGTVAANSIPVTYTPEAGKAYASGTLTVSGGGLNFPVKIPVSAYLASDVLFTDFDGDNWSGSTYSGYCTSDGWTVINGQRTTYTSGFNSVAAASVSAKGSLISPPKSGGIGAIQFYARGASSYTPSGFSVYVSEDGITWGEPVGSATDIPTDAYQEYIYTVNSAGAKYVKVVVSGYECYIENFTVTKAGTGISKVSFSAPAAFLASKGVPQTLPVTLTGTNITSGLTVSFKQGTAFSSTVSAIAATEFNPTYELPVIFQSETGVYFQDTLVVSGDCLPFDYTLPLKGTVLQDRLFENFDDPGTASGNNNYVTANGWTVTGGSRDTYGAGFNSVAALSIGYSGGEIVSPPKSGGVGSIQFYAKNSYSAPLLAVSVSENGTDWTLQGNSIDGINAAYSEYIVTVNSPTARYIKIAGTASCYLENITVTPNGAGISKVLLENQPVFKTGKGVEQTEYLELSGENITSELTVRFKQGNAFTPLVTAIPASEINGTTYELPVKFQSETGSYLLDTLVLSGTDLPFDYSFPLKGYVLQDLISQDFNGNWVQGASYEFQNVDGWEITYGSKQTYSDVYEGSAAVSLSRSSYSTNPTSPATILSVPKSGGTGIISFYYETSYNAATLQVVTYKTLAGEATVIETINVPANTPYTHFSKAVNDADAQYVEIQLLPDEANYSSIYIDAVIVTANGKAIPVATTPQALRLSAYDGETDVRTLDLHFEAVEEEIHLSLAGGADFSIDKTAITPASEGVTTATVTVTYTPEAFFSEDVLLIESAGLLKPISIPVYGNLLQDTLFQDFNKEGWVMTTVGNGALDGWIITQGRRTTQAEMIEGDPNTGGSLRLDAATAGNLVSPAKSGGINTVEFYYRSQISYANSTGLITETSADGQNWNRIDSLALTVSEFHPVKHLYSKEIKDNDARYFRILTNLPANATQNMSGYLYLDSIAIDALPYLRRIGDAPEVATANLSVNIPVSVAGILNTAAAITLEASEDAGYFSLTKTEITPDDIAGENIASFDVIFSGRAAESGEYLARIRISTEEDGVELYIPLSVDYTKAYLEVLNTVEPVETLTVPVTIPVSVSGLLRTDASMALAVGTNCTLDKTTLTPEELADGTATVAFNVTFTAESFATYKDTVIISNTGIDEVRIPLSVRYYGTGIEPVSGAASVYLAKDGVLNVLGARAGTKVTVSTVQGQTVFNAQVENSGREHFDVSLPSGIYIVRVGDTAWKVKK
jgi:hypothetical protein